MSNDLGTNKSPVAGTLSGPDDGTMKNHPRLRINGYSIECVAIDGSYFAKINGKRVAMSYTEAIAWAANQPRSENLNLGDRWK